jgi:hypothetical protein
VLRPDTDPDHPKVIYSGSEYMWWGGDDFGEIKAGATDFEVRFHSRSIDTGVHNRLFIKHFKVLNNQISRIPPIAASPQEFVDEWIVSKWKEASDWSLAENRKKLKMQHDRLLKQQKHDLTYESIHRCSDTPNRFQIEIVDNDCREYFFRVDGNETYKMIDVSQSPDPKCTGKNLLEY